jgi:hypothetical protein
MKKKALVFTALAIILVAGKSHIFAMFKGMKMPNMPSIDEIKKVIALEESLKKNFQAGTNALRKNKETVMEKLKEYQINHSQAALNDFLHTITAFDQAVIQSLQQTNALVKGLGIANGLHGEMEKFLNEFKDTQLLLSTAIDLNQQP